MLLLENKFQRSLCEFLMPCATSLLLNPHFLRAISSEPAASPPSPAATCPAARPGVTGHPRPAGPTGAHPDRAGDVLYCTELGEKGEHGTWKSRLVAYLTEGWSVSHLCFQQNWIITGAWWHRGPPALWCWGVYKIKTLVWAFFSFLQLC